MGVSCWFPIAGLHVMSRQPCRWSRTKVFLSSGNKTLFSCTLFKKKSIVLTPNMAAFSCHMVANQEIIPGKLGDFPSQRLLNILTICRRLLNIAKNVQIFSTIFEHFKSYFKGDNFSMACCDTVTTLQVKIFVK